MLSINSIRIECEENEEGKEKTIHSIVKTYEVRITLSFNPTPWLPSTKRDVPMDSGIINTTLLIAKAIEYLAASEMIVSESIASRVMCLPLYVGLSTSELNQIITTINFALK